MSCCCGPFCDDWLKYELQHVAICDGGLAGANVLPCPAPSPPSPANLPASPGNCVCESIDQPASMLTPGRWVLCSCVVLLCGVALRRDSSWAGSSSRFSSGAPTSSSSSPSPPVLSSRCPGLGNVSSSICLLEQHPAARRPDTASACEYDASGSAGGSAVSQSAEQLLRHKSFAAQAGR